MRVPERIGGLKWFLWLAVGVIGGAIVQQELGIYESPGARNARLAAEHRAATLETQAAERIVQRLRTSSTALTEFRIGSRELYLTIGATSVEPAHAMAREICSTEWELFGWDVIVSLVDGTPAARCQVSVTRELRLREMVHRLRTLAAEGNAKAKQELIQARAEAEARGDTQLLSAFNDPLPPVPGNR